MPELSSFLDTIGQFFGSMGHQAQYMFLYILRILVPVLALVVIVKCYRSVKLGRRPEAPVMILEDISSHTRIPVLYWENSIGRSKSCDISLPDATMSRDHAVLMRREQGWFIIDTNSKAGTSLNGKRLKPTRRAQVFPGDTIAMGSSTLRLQPAMESDVKKRRFSFSGSGRAASPFGTLLLTALIHVLMAIQCCFAPMEEEQTFSLIPLALLGALLVIEFGFYLFSTKGLGRVSFEVETVALLFSGIGIFLLAGDDVSTALTQLVAMVGGIVIFCILIWFMGDLERVTKWRLPLALCAVGLLALTLVIGTSINGSKNWIFIGPVSIQPSELAKIVFIFAGAATLDKLQTTRNLTEFIVLAALCGGCLVLMKDLGSAAVFFVTFLIISFMRSGSIRTIVLSCSAVVIGLFMFLQARPYAAARFQGWRNVWDHINDNLGYQQSRTLTYTASGGFFGTGLGEGYLHNVAAGNSDLVFGMMAEELGLLLAVITALSMVLWIFYARTDVTRSRSTFYSISACAAAGILVFQSLLNIFGPLDVIPLTGVTLPFISAGGSSMLSVWGMVAFIKASDERTYAVRRRTVSASKSRKAKP